MVANLLGKRQGAVGLAYERTPGSAETAEVYALPCDSANIEVNPVTYERTNNLDENPIGVERSGFEYSFSISGMEVDIETLGYIFWLYLGVEDNTTPGTHLITPQFDSKEFTLFKDHGGVMYDTDKRSEVLQGCKISEISIEQPMKEYAKVSISGWGKAKSYTTREVSRSINFGTDAGALSWNAISNGGSIAFPFGLHVDFDGAVNQSLDAVQGMTSVKVSSSRELTRAGMNLSTDDARGIIEGGRTLEYEFTLDLASGPNTDIDRLLAAFEGNKRFNTTFGWKVDNALFHITIPDARVTGNPKGELGTGTDPQQLTFSLTAFKFDAAKDLITVVSETPLNLTDYDSRAGA